MRIHIKINPLQHKMNNKKIINNIIKSLFFIKLKSIKIDKLIIIKYNLKYIEYKLNLKYELNPYTIKSVKCSAKSYLK